jgi:hypothetical protein
MKLKRKKLESTAVYSITNANNSDPAYPATKQNNEFLSMTLGERAYIAQYIIKEFCPTKADKPSSEFKKKYSSEWWKTNVQYIGRNNTLMNGDVAYFVLNACVFPERSQENWEEPKCKPIDFYCEVTEDNALDWYDSCPEHLRKRIDSAVEKYSDPTDAKEADPIYQIVAEQWGNRFPLKFTNDPNFGKELDSHYIELELYNQWCSEYEKQVIRTETLNLAPSMQKERKLLNKAMGLDVDTDGLPNQADGLDPTTGATVRWLQESGEMPLEFLARTYRSEDNKISDRLTAARTLMDYVHRKVPQKSEIDTKLISEPRLNPTLLRELSAKDLDLLEELLKKLV